MAKKKTHTVDVNTGELTELTKPIIKTQHTARYYPKDDEVNKEKSLTQPGQSMSILKMIENHRKGLPIEGQKGIPVYNGEEILPDLKNMDLADREAYIDSVADHLVEVRLRIDEAKKVADQKSKIEEFEKWHKERLKKMAAEADLNPTDKITQSGEKK